MRPLYDVRLFQPTEPEPRACGHCGHEHACPRRVDLFESNHTSNTACMWREAGCDLRDFDGKTSAELFPALRSAISQMQEQRGRFRRMEPENKWGTYESTLKFLGEILAACHDHPEAIVEVSA